MNDWDIEKNTIEIYGQGVCGKLFLLAIFFIVSNLRIVRLISLQNTHCRLDGLFLDISSFSSDLTAEICCFLQVSTGQLVIVALQKWCPSEEICSEDASDGSLMTLCLSEIAAAKNQIGRAHV